MKLNSLPKTTTAKKKRRGRGYGSGKGGHTVGRGAKGLKARNKNTLLFEGTKMKKSLIKRLPLTRGKGKFRARPKPLVINLKYLNLFSPKTTVDLNSLIAKNIVKKDEAQKFGLKILGEGELKIPLEIALPCSQSARKKIEKAGGKVSPFPKTPPPTTKAKTIKVTKPVKPKKSSKV
jgi:large subunit ribosomal protein L15